MSYFDQEPYAVRCEWGGTGLAELLPRSDAIVIVDVLSFTTCVDVATARGAAVYPYRWRDQSAAAYADSLGAFLAGPNRRVETGFSLSPASLMGIPKGIRLVLPSPNGSTLTLATGAVPTFAGCLRNARAVAEAAARVGPRVSVIPAGERWHDGTLRPSLEDLLGAGAIIHHLPGTRSPEAEHAEHTYLRCEGEVLDHLQRCSSGRELIEQGFADDVLIAGQLNASECAPLLTGAAYVCAGG